MASTDVFQRHSIESTQTVKTVLLLLLAVTATLMLGLGHHNAIMLGILLGLFTVVLPGSYMVRRSLKDKARQRETEDRLMMHTRTFLQNQEPARPLDGWKLPIQDFRKFHGTASVRAVADPVTFGLLRRQDAIRSLYEWRFTDLSAALPGPESVPLSELLPRPPRRTGSARRGRRT
jgi:hypothetical protein